MENARILPQMSIRIPADVKEQLKQKAKEAFRSMNDEIAMRLIKTLKEEEKQEPQHAAQ